MFVDLFNVRSHQFRIEFTQGIRGGIFMNQVFVVKI